MVLQSNKIIKSIHRYFLEPCLGLRCREKSNYVIMKGGHIMTQNQIAYYKARKEAEHYATMDSENARHDRATEQESVRHSLATESLQGEQNRLQAAYNTGQLEHFQRMDTESARTNRENEQIKRQQNLENIRHDVVTEGYTAEQNRISKLQSDIRALEQRETVRHDLATEKLTASKQEAEINKLQAESESLRSNVKLDEIRFENIKSNTLLNLENVKNAGFDRLLTEQKIHSEAALAELRRNESIKAYNEAIWGGVKSFSSSVRDLLTGIKGVPVNLPVSNGTYDSSVYYNAYTGLYE